MNEPIYAYDKGSKERTALEEKLKEYDSQVHKVPIVIGDEEITSDNVQTQVRVSLNILCLIDVTIPKLLDR